jgi:hypothetical protein
MYSHQKLTDGVENIFMLTKAKRIAPPPNSYEN